jgi:uncharacterized membrane protein
MSTKTIDIKNAIKTGWKIAIDNLTFFILILLSFFFINLGENFITDKFFKGESIKEIIIHFLILIAFYFLNLLIGIGLIKISLALCRNKKPHFTDLFSGVNLISKYFIISLIVGVFTVLPTLIPAIAFAIILSIKGSGAAIIIARVVIGLLIIAGIAVTIYLSLRFMFSQYIMIDKNVGIIEAIKKSGQLTEGIKWQLILLILALTGIIILGVLAVVIGLFVAIPLSMIASATVYLQLSGNLTNTAKTEIAA